MLQGITEKVKKQAEQGICSGFIKHSKKAKDYLDSEQKHYCGTIVDRYLEDKHYRVRMQTDMEEFDRVANEKKDSHLLLLKKGVTTETNTRSSNTTMEEAATP